MPKAEDNWTKDDEQRCGYFRSVVLPEQSCLIVSHRVWLNILESQKNTFEGLTKFANYLLWTFFLFVCRIVFGKGWFTGGVENFWCAPIETGCILNDFVHRSYLIRQNKLCPRRQLSNFSAVEMNSCDLMFGFGSVNAIQMRMNWWSSRSINGIASGWWGEAVWWTHRTPCITMFVIIRC